MLLYMSIEEEERQFHFPCDVERQGVLVYPDWEERKLLGLKRDSQEIKR